MKALDGPAVGASLLLRACPEFLRVTINQHGKVDALDQPEDTPAADEVPYAYRIVPGTWGQMFVRPGGRYSYGDYRLIDSQPDPEVMLDRARWISYVQDVLRGEGFTEHELQANRRLPNPKP